MFLYTMSRISQLNIIALGGSILVPHTIQTAYLRRLHSFLLKQINEGRRFLLVVGGGATARNYQQAASQVVHIENEDKDWLGIHSTRINAHLVRTIFADHAYPIVLDNPEKTITQYALRNYKLFIASGWRPGWSTDYIAIRFAHRFHIPKVIIATTIPYVYTKDITQKGARPLTHLSWDQYIRLLPTRDWEPGMKVPVDPIATMFAKQHKIACVILRGTNLRNLERYLIGHPFRGTIINN